jgi:membrane protein implicated in regulation of membrane protease activity
MFVRGVNGTLILAALAAFVALLALPGSAHAYIGPGAGLEFVGYFMALLATAGMAFAAMLLYPIYAIIRFFRSKETPPTAPSPQMPEAAQGESPAATDAVSGEETGIPLN